MTLLLVLAAALPVGGSAQTLKAEVLSIGDGDTIRVRQVGRVITVRLACIDAPERPEYPWPAGAPYLQQHLPNGREVSLEVKTTDRYGCTVAEVIAAAERVSGRKIAVQNAPRRPGDPARLVADARLARQVLAWQPQHSDLHTIVGHAWQWEQKLVAQA